MATINYLDESYKPKPVNYMIGNLDVDGCSDRGFETEEEAIKFAKKQAKRNPGSSIGVFKICKKITPPEPNVEDVNY